MPQMCLLKAFFPGAKISHLVKNTAQITEGCPYSFLVFTMSSSYLDRTRVRARS